MLVTLLLGVIAFRGYRQKKRSASELSEQKKIIEEKNHDITNSILYAQRIQEAMLPALERPHEVSALYLDSIFLAIRDYIAETYGGFTKKAASPRLGLTAR